jgi:hypothetical protein
MAFKGKCTRTKTVMNDKIIDQISGVDYSGSDILTKKTI